MNKRETTIIRHIFDIEYMIFELQQYCPDAEDSTSTKHEIAEYKRIYKVHDTLYEDLEQFRLDSLHSLLGALELSTEEKFDEMVREYQDRFQFFVTVGRDFVKLFWTMPHAATNCGEFQGWVLARLQEGKWVPPEICPDWDRSEFPGFQWESLL